MSHRVLLYGATGYSGRLMAAEAHARIRDRSVPGGFQVLLGGRDSRALAGLARQHHMEPRVFGLGSRQGVLRALSDVDVVLNAAGPFALTAEPLAKAAIEAGCHYVDINGEPDVYMTIDDLARPARLRRCALVSAAGHTAAASDLLLHAALQWIRETLARIEPGQQEAPTYSGADPDERLELGSVRIALSQVTTLSRGSLETVWRSLRDQVRVVQTGEEEDARGRPRLVPVLWHEPVGKLERVFDFDHYDGAAPQSSGPSSRDPRIATAANLVDTLTARLTLHRGQFQVRRLESYVEAGRVRRLAYQVGTLLTPWAALPWVRDVARLQIDALPSGPTPHERARDRHVVVLEVEDTSQRPILDWKWHIPNPYDFTAQVAVETALRVSDVSGGGWFTPSDVLRPSRHELTSGQGYLRGCRLNG